MTEIYVVGSGGHARSIAELLSGAHNVILVTLEQETSGIFPTETEQTFFETSNRDVRLVNGIGAKNNALLRKFVQQKFEKEGFEFSSVVADSVEVSKTAIVGTGSQLLPRAFIGSGAVIESNVVIGAGTIVEHNCVIQRGAFVGPGSVLCGGVNVGAESFIGAGAVITPNVFLPAQSFVKAASLANHKSVTGRRDE